MSAGLLTIPKPTSCSGCPLFGNGRGFSRPSGTPIYGVGLLGEALGEAEEEAGLPFRGKAGKFLSRMLARTGHPTTGVPLKMEDFLIWNTIACRPPDNHLTGAPYEAEALQRCRTHLDPVLADPRIKVWVALGNQALRATTGEWGIDSRRLRGYTFDGPHGKKVIGTYHPSYLMRGQHKLVKVWQTDVLKAVRLAETGPVERPTNYTLYPTLEDLKDFHRRWVAAGKPLLAFDIETPYDEDLDAEDKDADFVAVEDTKSYTILRCSFAFERGKAITFPWQTPFIGEAAAILAGAEVSTGWNSLSFDIPRLGANGVPVMGRHIDGMLAWHALEPALPMSLKYVAPLVVPGVEAWAVRSHSDPEFYNAADSDITLECVEYIRGKLQSQGRWEMFERHFVQLYEVLRTMSKRGINVDVGRRAAEAAKLTARFDDTVRSLQPLVPQEVKPRKVYKKTEAQLRKAGLWLPEKMIELAPSATISS